MVKILGKKIVKLLQQPLNKQLVMAGS